MNSHLDRAPPAAAQVAAAPDIVCFSHLRWDFVYQRPQHLMSRFARRHRVLFFEEPIERPVLRPHVTPRVGHAQVVVPHLPPGLSAQDAETAHRALIDETLARFGVHDFVLWLSTPMPMPLVRHLAPRAIAYDCMDELSAFKDAPAELLDRERELLARADVVFTGGASLFAAKCARHPRVRLMPSSVDAEHFLPARDATRERDGVGALPPRIGYAGVIDERIDLALLAAVADGRPTWQFVMLGPVVKIDPATLPRRPNIQYVGFRSYHELPAWLGTWDVGMMPFAHNDATRFISPTKTLEYLAAGLPVVSTSIPDVRDHYGATGAALIADTPEAFVAAIDVALGEPSAVRHARADALLARTSWDATWCTMASDLGITP